MKKVLVALTMVMGMGSAVAFAQEPVKLPAMEQNQQTSQDKFTKITIKEQGVCQSFIISIIC